MKTNIALIGFMGAGKSAIGQVLAQRLGWRFVEVDAVIEKTAGKSVAAIFQDDGEIAFRELEIAAIKQVAQGEKQVIACGGGVVLNTINISRLRENAVIILLLAAPQTVLQRIKRDKNVRPLLQNTGDPAGRIRELMRFRKPFYERAADIIINTTRMDIPASVAQILQKLRADESINRP